MLLLPTDTSTVEILTYQHEDPLTRQILTCTLCPPGTHMSKYCTATEDTICLPCPEDHFTQFWNYLPKWLYCSTFCVENQYIEIEWSTTNNRICQCKEGYFWQADFCIKHAECPYGYGVKHDGIIDVSGVMIFFVCVCVFSKLREMLFNLSIGTLHDTKCERCVWGTFSAVTSSTSPCIKHTDCKSIDLDVVPRGTSWHDNICSTCKNLQNAGKFSNLSLIVVKSYIIHIVKSGNSQLLLEILLLLV